MKIVGYNSFIYICSMYRYHREILHSVVLFCEPKHSKKAFIVTYEQNASIYSHLSK